MYSVLKGSGSKMSGWLETGFALVVMALLTFSLGLSAHAQLYDTYYVRSDGGSAGQCTGLVDARPTLAAGRPSPAPGTIPFVPCHRMARRASPVAKR